MGTVDLILAAAETVEPSHVWSENLQTHFVTGVLGLLAPYFWKVWATIRKYKPLVDAIAPHYESVGPILSAIAPHTDKLDRILGRLAEQISREDRESARIELAEVVRAELERASGDHETADKG